MRSEINIPSKYFSIPELASRPSCTCALPFEQINSRHFPQSASSMSSAPGMNQCPVESTSS